MMRVNAQQILPIVVLYGQGIGESQTMKSLRENLGPQQYMDVFVYDNSPQAQHQEASFTWQGFRVTYRHDPANSGLSKAYNEGAKEAARLGKTWLLLLDQDTTLPSNILERYQHAATEHPDMHLFAPVLKLANGTIFSPSLVKHKRGYPPASIVPGKYSLYQYSPVNSGVFISLALFQEAGGYNEKVKVDFCDFQFMEKVRRLAADFIVIDAIAEQDFSSDEPSIEKQQRRFKIYLTDAQNCDKPQLADKLGFFYTVTRHALGLTYKMRSFSFLKMYFRSFLIGK